ncbi:hypothetical protein [Singulisphaera sp. PoT]
MSLDDEHLGEPTWADLRRTAIAVAGLLIGVATLVYLIASTP